MSTSALSPGTEVRSPQRTYTIQRVLGQGGFGITYLVETECKMGKLSFSGKFALKEHFIQMMCEREAATNRVRFVQSATKEVQASMRAFISEAQRLQRLGIDHRNIVNVDEVFEANGTAYYVMEYLNGGTLASYVKTHGGRLSWEETKALMQPICESVAMLHRNRVAHYDIKPQNIMVMTDKQGLRPVLIDFGLAKHYDGQGEATSSLAAGGYTPGYAPMEQYIGMRQFSPATDVYALAATICFCLTGHAPAKADELNLDELCDELLSFGVSDVVANVLLQAMELRPAARPADAGALTTSLFNGASLTTVRKPRPSGGGGTPTQAKDRPATVPEPTSDTSLSSCLAPIVAILSILTIGVVLKLAFESGGETTQLSEAADTIAAESVVVKQPAQHDQPVEQLISQEQQESTQQSVAQQSSVLQYRTNPSNLDLQVMLDGKKYYFSVDEWQNSSRSEQLRFTKCGVVITYSGQNFVVNLNIERHSNTGYKYSEIDYAYTWEEAMRQVMQIGNGWRLPNYVEARAMADHYTVVNEALRAFGGEAGYYCWTSTNYQYSSSAWYFHLNYGRVNLNNKNTINCVRAVRAI